MTGDQIQPSEQWSLASGHREPLWAFDKSYGPSIQENASAHTVLHANSGVHETLKSVHRPQRTPTLEAAGSAPPTGGPSGHWILPQGKERRRKGN